MNTQKIEKLTCRFCSTVLKHTFCDLGMTPLANSFVGISEINAMEPFFPLHVYVCEECFLVQLPEHEKPENIFTDYAYFSSFSEGWLKHSKKYTNDMVSRFHFNKESKVIEIASNDGYLLQYFNEMDIPVLGIEPAVNVANEAIKKGVQTITEFFGVKTARKLRSEGVAADLLLGNNVLAHVPDINDFVSGMFAMIKDDGIITMEFPHLINLMINNQFDTIYHEHYSYLSLTTVKKIFEQHGLKLFDVDKLSTHGGSIRIYACKQNNDKMIVSESLQDLLLEEKKFGVENIGTYLKFHEHVKKIKRNILNVLMEKKNSNASIIGYGAAAKGNTLLNYCGIKTDFLDYVVDKSPHKQNHVMPGTHIPIFDIDMIKKTKPDYILILPWNIQAEIIEQTAFVRDWGCKYIVPIPDVKVI